MLLFRSPFGQQNACGGDGRGGVVLGGENVAGAPAYFGAEGDEGLDAAVCTVIWMQPMIRAPARGALSA